jgi:hypothetical protein
MRTFFKDYLPSILCIATLICGMAWTSGAQSTKIDELQHAYESVKHELSDTRKSMDDLRVSIVQLTQRMDDESKKSK